MFDMGWEDGWPAWVVRVGTAKYVTKFSGLGMCTVCLCVINPWCACTARVMVLGLSVCLSMTVLAVQATRQLSKYCNGHETHPTWH